MELIDAYKEEKMSKLLIDMEEGKYTTTTMEIHNETNECKKYLLLGANSKVNILETHFSDNKFYEYVKDIHSKYKFIVSEGIKIIVTNWENQEKEPIQFNHKIVCHKVLSHSPNIRLTLMEFDHIDPKKFCSPNRVRKRQVDIICHREFMINPLTYFSYKVEPKTKLKMIFAWKEIG